MLDSMERTFDIGLREIARSGCMRRRHGDHDIDLLDILVPQGQPAFFKVKGPLTAIRCKEAPTGPAGLVGRFLGTDTVTHIGVG